MIRCPVVGCDHKQKDWRTPDLKRHIPTHVRRLESDKWICCCIPTVNIHLYGKDIEPGMTEDELIGTRACRFGDRVMIGGRLKSFAGRDASERHVDNPNIPCWRFGFVLLLDPWALGIWDSSNYLSSSCRLGMLLTGMFNMFSYSSVCVSPLFP